MKFWSPVGIVLSLLLCVAPSSSLRSPSQSSSAFTANIQQQQETNKTRQQEGHRECGDVIGVILPHEVTLLGQVFATSLIPVTGIDPASQDLLDAISALVGIPRYALLVYKVCGSCDDIEQDNDEDDNNNNDRNSPYRFDAYCAKGVYGSDSTQSALVMQPVDPQTLEVISGTFKASMQLHDTFFDVETAPTDIFPPNITEFFAAVDGVTFFRVFRSYLQGIIAAAEGTVTIFPDFVGYGESRSFNQTYLAKLPYAQTAAISFSAARSALKQPKNDGGCIQLAKEVTVMGYSEGAYAAVSATQALRNIGVKVLKTFSQAGPYDGDLQTIFTINSFDLGLIDPSKSNFFLNLAVAYLAYGYSIDLPFLPNSFTGQNLARDDRLEEIVSWFAAPEPLTDAELRVTVDRDGRSLLNQDLLDAVRESIEKGENEFCTDPPLEIRALCQASLENSLIEELKAFKDPIEFCQTEDDTSISPEIYSAVVNDETFANNENLSEYQPPLPFLTAKAGDHFFGAVICAYGVSTYFQTANLSDPDAPQFIDQCPPPTPAPPTKPTPKPTRKPVSAARGIMRKRKGHVDKNRKRDGRGKDKVVGKMTKVRGKNKVVGKMTKVRAKNKGR